MKTRRIISVVVVFSVILTSSIAFTAWRGWRGSGGWGMESQYGRMYNPATVETVSGTVESVNKITPVKGMYAGIHVMLKTDKETISVLNGM